MHCRFRLQPLRFLPVVVLFVCLFGVAADKEEIAAFRIRLKEAGVEELAAALNHENRIVRRTAVRFLIPKGEAGASALAIALKNEDALVRRTALLALLKLDDGKQLDYLKMAGDDSSPVIRKLAVEALAGRKAPRGEECETLLQKAAKDEAEMVRNIAVRALWSFHRNVVPIRERTDWDYEVVTVKEIKLPKEGWKFLLDPKRDGHIRKVFSPNFDDGDWREIAIEQSWQKAGYEYTGVSWYRRTIELPAKPEGKINATEIRFAGVDESAWVWVNGIYVGEHNIGPSGWNVPFVLDITKEVKWGGENQITVRAMNTANAGGIWKPVFIDALR